MSRRKVKHKPQGLRTLDDVRRMRRRALKRGSEFVLAHAYADGRLVGTIYVENRTTTLLGYLDDVEGVEAALKYFTPDTAKIVRLRMAAWRAQQAGVTGRA
jgi:hypothetical protein